MKYTQLIMGLLIGTVIGGIAVTSQAVTIGGGAPVSDDHIRQIVDEQISNDGKQIMDAVQKFQNAQRDEDQKNASEVLKDPAMQDAIFHDDTLAFAGNPKGTHLVAEFFDYNCPVCHMQYGVFADLLKSDPELKIIFHEFPIFGPASDQSSKIGFAVQHYYPEKYFAFHQKMMSGKGHDQTEKMVDGYLKDLGFDVAKLHAYAKSDEAAKSLDKARDLAQKLHLQGTPSIVVGTTLITHAVDKDQLESMLNKPQ